MKKIGVKEISTVCLSLCFAIFPAFGTSLILQLGKNSSFLIIFVGTILGIVPLIMILYISKFLKNKTIFEFNKDNFKFMGNIINILYIIGVVFIGFIISWSIVNFTITQLLPRTSYYFVAIVLFFIAGFAVTKGYEVIGRTTMLLTIAGFIILGIALILLFPQINIDNYLPLFNISFKDFFNTALIVPSIIAYPLVTILTIKKDDVDNLKKFNLAIIIGYLAASFFAILFVFLIIGIYSSEFATIFAYPEYYLFKQVRALDYFSRLENIISIILYISFFGNLCALISFVKIYIQEKFKIKKEKGRNIIAYSFALVVPLISIYLFKNFHIKFLIRYAYIFTSIIFLALIINFILCLIKRKRLN